MLTYTVRFVGYVLFLGEFYSKAVSTLAKLMNFFLFRKCSGKYFAFRSG